MASGQGEGAISLARPLPGQSVGFALEEVMGWLGVCVKTAHVPPPQSLGTGWDHTLHHSGSSDSTFVTVWAMAREFLCAGTVFGCLGQVRALGPLVFSWVV